MAKKISQDTLLSLHTVLTALRSVPTPVTVEEVSKATAIEIPVVRHSISYLKDQGYDIKRIVHGKIEQYVLVRYGQNELGQYYRSQGDVKTPCILAADWHIGSVGLSEHAIQRMIRDTKEHGIRDIIVPGDFYQGRGVHRMELEDCKTLSVDEQVRWGTEIIDRFPKNTRFHAVMGNHEEVVKGSIHVGHDMLLSTAQQRDNFLYYGHVAKLMLNKKFSMLLIHTSGGLTYAKTYKAERVFDQLLERPHILVTGHMHQLFTVGRPPNIVVCQAGTLQRENSYLLNKGVTAQVGYLILHDFTAEDALIQVARPKIF